MTTGVPITHRTLTGVLLGLLWLFINSAGAQQEFSEFSLNCPDLDDSNSCSLSVGGITIQGLDDLDVDDVDPDDFNTGTLDALSDLNNADLTYLRDTLLDRIQSIEQCIDTGQSSAVCESGDIQITCINITDDSASCSFNEPTRNNDVVTLSCDRVSSTMANCQISLPRFSGDQITVIGALTDPVLTPPQQAVGETIGTICPDFPDKKPLSPELQRDCDAVVGAAIDEDPNAVTAVAQVTPDDASAPADAAVSSINAQTRNIGARLSALRRGVSGFTISGLSLDGEALAMWYPNSHLQGGSAGSHESGFSRLGGFVNGSIVSGEKDRTPNEDGFDISSYELTGGLDYRFTDSIVAGLALGLSAVETDVDDNGGGLDVDGYELTLYGSYSRPTGLWLDGMLAYAKYDYDQERTIRYDLAGGTSVNQTASADFDGYQAAFSLGGGYEWSREALTLTPSARLQYLRLAVDGYEESLSNPAAEGSGWGVELLSQDYESLTLTAGAQASYAISTSWGVLLPYGGLEWIHEFEDDNRPIVGIFLGDPNEQSFRLPIDEADPNYFRLSLGSSAIFAQGRSAYLQYQTILGYDDLSHHSISAGLRLEF